MAKNSSFIKSVISAAAFLSLWGAASVQEASAQARRKRVRPEIVDNTFSDHQSDYTQFFRAGVLGNTATPFGKVPTVFAETEWRLPWLIANKRMLSLTGGAVYDPPTKTSFSYRYANTDFRYRRDEVNSRLYGGVNFGTVLNVGRHIVVNTNAAMQASYFYRENTKGILPRIIPRVGAKMEWDWLFAGNDSERSISIGMSCGIYRDLRTDYPDQNNGSDIFHGKTYALIGIHAGFAIQ